jgi:hypothetical protein
MNNIDKQSIDLIGDAYKNYCLSYKDGHEFYEDETVKRSYTQEEFINKIKTDDEFAAKWGVKVEVRELSLRERMNLCREKLDDTDDGEILLPSDIEYRMNNYWGIPTRAISLTYNDKTIESYE